jgi:hypothetical protein
MIMYVVIADLFSDCTLGTGLFCSLLLLLELIVKHYHMLSLSFSRPFIHILV